MSNKTRLDVLLTEQGLQESRQKAQATIMSGLVFVNGQRVDKPGTAVPNDARIEIRGNTLRYVSRGGLKLEKAMAEFPIDLKGCICGDIGASTGGFTDCMLQNGADKVYAVDVGYGQLAWKLREDPRVVCLERTNARYLTHEQIPDELDFASIDVSFISLKLILPAVAGVLKNGGQVASLVKPQFEAGKEKVGKKGVVRDPAVHKEVLEHYLGHAKEAGFGVLGLTYSPIRGPEGNIEYLGFLQKGATQMETFDLDALVEESHRDLKGAWGGSGIMDTRTIILCPNPDRDHGMRATKTAIQLLQELGFQTAVCSPFRSPKAGAFGDLAVKPLLTELKNASLIITLGGDGTILHLAKLAALNRIPMLGINMGGLGFLAELEVNSLQAMRGLKNWDFPIEERMMLDVSVLRDGKQIYANMGLNDAVIREGPISHVIHLKISSDGKHLVDIAGDGAIIATPTGSTAYSLSAGGPVVEPCAQTMLLTPICTHNMRFSSYVLSPEHTLTVELERNGRKPVYLFVDESRAFPLRSNDVVQIRRSRHVTRLAHLSEKSFCEVFAQKMLPGGLQDEK